MNTFTSMETSDILENRFRVDEKHTPQYVAECLQRLFPSLGRVSPSNLINEIARANSRAYNSSNLPVRGETLNLSFFFDMWKKEFRFEGSIGDRFVFTDELRMAFSINPREFWEGLIRSDRELGTYLKDAYELYQYRDLPHEMSINRHMNGSSIDEATIRRLRDKLPHMRENFSSKEIVKVGLEVLGLNPLSDYELRNLVEKIERENSLHRVGNEKFVVIPKKSLDRLSTNCLLEHFKNSSLDSAEIAAMDKGIYTVTQADLSLISRQGNDAFWQSIISDTQERNDTLQSWNLIGLDTQITRSHLGQDILIIKQNLIDEAVRSHRDDINFVYRMCGGELTLKEVEKIMGLLYICHDFYENVADIDIDVETMKELRG